MALLKLASHPRRLPPRQLPSFDLEHSALVSVRAELYLSFRAHARVPRRGEFYLTITPYAVLFAAEIDSSGRLFFLPMIAIRDHSQAQGMLKSICEIRERGSLINPPAGEYHYRVSNYTSLGEENGERSPAYLSFGGECESISHRLLFLDRSPSLSFINHVPRLSFARAYYPVVLTAVRICKNAME